MLVSTVVTEGAGGCFYCTCLVLDTGGFLVLLALILSVSFCCICCLLLSFLGFFCEIVFCTALTPIFTKLPMVGRANFATTPSLAFVVLALTTDLATPLHSFQIVLKIAPIDFGLDNVGGSLCLQEAQNLMIKSLIMN